MEDIICMVGMLLEIDGAFVWLLYLSFASLHSPTATMATRRVMMNCILEICVTSDSKRLPRREASMLQLLRLLWLWYRIKSEY
jgi:hypothetical protein